jgi:hypothetical protein
VSDYLNSEINAFLQNAWCNRYPSFDEMKVDFDSLLGTIKFEINGQTIFHIRGAEYVQLQPINHLLGQVEYYES